MQEYKIEHFNEEWPDKTFPKHRTLDTSELLTIQAQWRKKLHLAEDVDLLNLAKKISELETVITGINVEDVDFCLSDFMASLRIKPNEYIYINWYRYDDIDTLTADDLSRYFGSIWYPGSDDIDIFDDTYSWVLSVRHDGVPSTVKL